MGEMNGSVNFHYSKANIEALRRIANDTSIDEDDRDNARKFINEIEKKNQEKSKQEDEKEIE